MLTKIMKRRIIKQGHNTLTITLPSKWVKNINLKQGDEVDLIEKENGLFLSTEKNSEFLKAKIDVSEYDIPTIWKYFMSIYRQGYDELEVRFNPKIRLESPYKFFAQHKLDLKYKKEHSTKTPLEFFNEMINRFIGFEIVNYGKDFILIKEMSAPTSKEFDNSLRRVFLLIDHMTEEICESLAAKDMKKLNHIHDIDINLDKFHDYCIRILNKIGNKNTRKTSLLISTLYFLELIGDEFKVISYHLMYDYIKANYKNIKEIIESLKEQLNLFYEVFYKFDQSKINKMSELDKERYFSVDNVSKKVKKEEEKEIFHHLRIITRYLNALTELRIEMEY